MTNFRGENCRHLRFTWDNLDIKKVSSSSKKPLEMADYMFCPHKKNNVPHFHIRRCINIKTSRHQHQNQIKILLAKPDNIHIIPNPLQTQKFSGFGFTWLGNSWDVRRDVQARFLLLLLLLFSHLSTLRRGLRCLGLPFLCCLYASWNSDSGVQRRKRLL